MFYFSSDGNFVLIAEWTRLGSFGKSRKEYLCETFWILGQSLGNAIKSVFFLFLALGAILFGEVYQFMQFWWIAFNEHSCYIILKFVQWFRRRCLLTLCLLVTSADYLCDPFGPRSGQTKRQV